MRKFCVLLCLLSLSPMALAMTANTQKEVAISGIGFPTQPPAQIAVDAGGLATITADAKVDCGSESYFQWYFGEMPLHGANQETLELYQITPEMAGWYRLYAWMDGQEGWSTECRLIIYSDLKVVDPQPWPQTKNVGDSVEFVVNFTGGTGPWTVTWYKDGVDLSAPNSTTLVLTNVQLTDAGSYNAIVTDSASNMAESMTAELTVLPAETPPPQLFVDWSGGNTYGLSMNPNGTPLTSVLANPAALPDGCDYGNISGVLVFHRLYDVPWTVLEDQPWGGVMINAESPAVTLTGSGQDWGGNPTSFVIDDNIFDISVAVQTTMTGADWLWLNVDVLETWINSTTPAPLNSGMFTIDLRP